MTLAQGLVAADALTDPDAFGVVVKTMCGKFNRFIKIAQSATPSDLKKLIIIGGFDMFDVTYMRLL